MKKPEQVVKVVSILVIVFSGLYIIGSGLVLILAFNFDLLAHFKQLNIPEYIRQFPSYSIALAVLDNISLIFSVIFILSLLSLFAGIRQLTVYSNIGRWFIILMLLLLIIFDIVYFSYLAYAFSKIDLGIGIQVYPVFIANIFIQSIPLGFIIWLMIHKDVRDLFKHKSYDNS